MSSKKPALIFIFITLVLDILGIGLIVPILPSLIKEIRGGTESDGIIAYGIILGIYALMQFFFAPILGALSDKYGRRKVILISLLGAGLDYFLLAWAPTLAWVIIGRIIAGITSANISVATAYISDISTPEKRAANFGLVGAAFGLGFVLGPALGGWIGGTYGPRAPFIVAGVITIFSWLYGLFILPESLNKQNRREFRLIDSNPFAVLSNLKRSSLLLGLAGVYFILSLGHQVFPAIWALYTEKRYFWGTKEIGYSLTAVGIMAVIVDGGLARKIIPKLGERKTALYCTLIGSASMIGYGLASQDWTVYTIIVWGAFASLVTPTLQGIISRAVANDEQGEIQGALTSLQSIAAAIGPPLFTLLFNYKKETNIGAGFFCASTIYLIGFVLMMFLFRKVPEKNSLNKKSDS